jgi:8-oxo-dGTP diphosphatase
MSLGGGDADLLTTRAVLRVVCGVVTTHDFPLRALVTRRGPAMAHAGAWEFPGGKVEPGESDATALERELAEELGLRVTVGALLAVADTPIGARVIRLAAYACTTDDTPELREHDALVWLDGAALDGVAWAPADVPLLGAVAKHLHPADPLP